MQTTNDKPQYIKLDRQRGDLLKSRAAALGKDRVGKAMSLTDYVIEASNFFEEHRPKKGSNNA